MNKSAIYDEGSGLAIEVVSPCPRNSQPVILFKWNVLNMKLILISLAFQPCIKHWAKEMDLIRNNS